MVNGAWQMTQAAGIRLDLAQAGSSGGT